MSNKSSAERQRKGRVGTVERYAHVQLNVNEQFIQDLIVTFAPYHGLLKSSTTTESSKT